MSTADDNPRDDELEREIAAALGDQSLDSLIDENPAPKPSAMNPADLDKEIDAALGGKSIDELMSGRAEGEEVRQGKFAEGVVTFVGTEDVFIEFGPREQGIVPAAQFAEPPEIGQTQRVFVSGFSDKDNLWVCGIRRQVQTANWDALEMGSILDAVVRSANTGGLEVQVGVNTAFLPASHIALERVEDLESFVGRTFQVEVIEINPEKRRLVVSRRGLLNRVRDAERQSAVSTLAVGSVVSGPVTRIEKFGGFIDLGGVDGLLHVSQIAHKRVEDPNEHLKVGDLVKVQILEVSDDGSRISLSMKALQEDPWAAWVARHPSGSIVQGKITRLASYGAFVEVIDGVEGLAHVSQLAPHPIANAREVVKVGETLSVRVVDVDPERKRIGLSLLTPRGDRLTDDVADDETIARLTGTNIGGDEDDDPGEATLGDILRKALEDN